MEKKWQGKKKRQGVTNIKDLHCLPPLKHLSCDTDKTTNSRCSCFFLYVCCIMMVRTLGVFHHPTLPTLHMGIFAWQLFHMGIFAWLTIPDADNNKAEDKDCRLQGKDHSEDRAQQQQPVPICLSPLTKEQERRGWPIMPLLTSLFGLFIKPKASYDIQHPAKPGTSIRRRQKENTSTFRQWGRREQ